VGSWGVRSAERRRQRKRAAPGGWFCAEGLVRLPAGRVPCRVVDCRHSREAAAFVYVTLLRSVAGCDGGWV